MMKGLFGKKPQYGAMMPGYSMPQDMAMQDGASLMQQQPVERPRGFWQGGDRFTGRDAIAGVLAAVGDALSTNAGGQGGAVGGLIQSRMAPMQEAALLAAEQRKRAAELADYEAKKAIDARFATPEQVKPRFEQDGAGNLWALDPVTGQPLSDKPVFIDRTERIINQNGALIRIPNPYAGGQSEAPDTLPPGFFQGGASGNVGGNFRGS